MKTIIILLFSLLSSYSYACSCMYSKFGIKDYQNANHVVEGKVIGVGVNQDQGEKLITFKVTRRIKGKTNKIIQISTGVSSAACGLNISKEDKWLLFVSDYNGKFSVGLCGKHIRFNNRKGELRDQRKKKRKLRKQMINQMKEFKKISYNEQ